MRRTNSSSSRMRWCSKMDCPQGYETASFGYGTLGWWSTAFREGHLLAEPRGELTGSIRVLIVDHHDMFVESLDRALRDVDDMEVVGTARSDTAAVQMAEHLRPSVSVIESLL